MEKLRLKIHPTFIIFAVILIYFGQGFLFLNYLCVMLLHELSHAFVARSLGYNLSSISIIPFGVSLNMSAYDMSPKDEIKIALAGPLLNAFLCLILFMLWWIFPSSYNYTILFFYANFVTCIFNLIPAFPLDGGRVLRGFFRSKTSENRAINRCKIINIFVIILLLGLFAFSCFSKVNLTYLFVCLCVATGLFDTSKSNRYTFVKFISPEKSKKVLKIKNLYVSSSEQIYKIYRYINNYSYINLYIFDKSNKLIKVMNENEYVKLCEKYSATATFERLLNKA